LAKLLNQRRIYIKKAGFARLFLFSGDIPRLPKQV